MSHHPHHQGPGGKGFHMLSQEASQSFPIAPLWVGGSLYLGFPSPLALWPKLKIREGDQVAQGHTASHLESSR